VLFPATAIQQLQQVNGVKCRTFLPGSSACLSFDSLRIPSGCNQIFCGSVNTHL